MKKIFLIICVFVLFLSCNRLDIEKGTPSCVKKEIRAFNRNKYTCNSGANVKEYKFQGKDVYVFDKGSCGADQTMDVITSDCNSIGRLGGISGNTEINGENFSNAVFVQTTWED